MIDRIGDEYHRMRPRLRSLALTSSDSDFVAALQDIIYEALEELSLVNSE